MAKQTEKAELKKGRAEFVITGAVKLNQYTFGTDLEGSNNPNWIYNKLFLLVDCGHGNVVSSQMMGGYMADGSSKIYAHGVIEEGGKKKDDWSNRIEIEWADRLDEDVLSEVGNKCFIKIGIEETDKGKPHTERFLSEYDAIKYLEKHLEDGMVVNVRGKLNYSTYKDNVNIEKQITSIYLSKAKPEEYKATFEQTILIDSDSAGKLDKERLSYPIDARIIEYIRKVDGEKINKNGVLPLSLELKVNEEKPAMTKVFVDKIFKVKKDVTSIGVKGIFVEGADDIEVDEEDIDPEVLELINAGLLDMDEIKGQMTRGDRTKRMLVTQPLTYVVEEEGQKKTKLLKEERKYTEDDLIVDYDVSPKEDVEVDEDSDLADLLSELEE